MRSQVPCDPATQGGRRSRPCSTHSKEDALAYINRILNTQDLFYWVVRLKDGNTPIGIISFLKRNYLEHFDLGFAFLPSFNGAGYAFEAANGILSMVQKNPVFHPILATTIPQNVNSIKLLIKLGFQFEREIEVELESLHNYSRLKLIRNEA